MRFFQADSTKAAGAVSLRKSHDIVILSFCNRVKGQANCANILLLSSLQELLCGPLTVSICMVPFFQIRFQRLLSSTLSHYSLEMEKGEELSISGLQHTFPILAL